MIEVDINQSDQRVTADMWLQKIAGPENTALYLLSCWNFRKVQFNSNIQS